MTARFATADEQRRWNDLVVANPDGGNVFASVEYAAQKVRGGYTPRFVMVGDLAVTVLEKNGGPLGKLWYLPKGPGVTSLDQLQAALDELRPFAAAQRVFALRVESELPRDCEPELQRRGYQKAIRIVPNNSTIVMDISLPTDELLAALPQKSRYAIKRAERDGVTGVMVDASDEHCKIMFGLLTDTASGQFETRSYAYYKSFWQSFQASGNGQLFFAYYDGEVVAGAFALRLGKKATYKDGASIRKRTAYGASHLLQWTVIGWAKSGGATSYDLCGTPPSDQIHNKDHGYYNIGLFKTSFAKTVSDYIGCYDYEVRPGAYRLWRLIGERIARRLHVLSHDDGLYY